MKKWAVSAILMTLLLSPNRPASADPGTQPATTSRPTQTWSLDRILITFWCPPPAEDAPLAAAAAEGFNLTWVPEAGLDVAARHGLKAMLTDPLLTPGTLDNPGQRAKLDALIDRVKHHPALEAYYLLDEPAARQFPDLGRLTAYLRQRDPAHFAYINLFPTYATNSQLGNAGDTETAYREHLRQYLDIVKPDLISYDHYSFFKTGDGDQYFLNLDLIRQAAHQARVPFLNIIQACTIEPSWRMPTAHELRWLIYTTLAYGGRGISYFVYWGPAAYGGLYRDGKPIPLIRDVTRLNHEIAALSPILMTMDSLGIYHTAPLPRGTHPVPPDCPVQIQGTGEYVLGLFGQSKKPSAFMLVNRSYQKSASPRVKLTAPAGAVREFDRAAKKWKPLNPIQPGIFQTTLKPGDAWFVRFAP